MDEKRYPIYGITITWEEDDENGKRKENGTGFERMYREDPGLDGAKSLARKYWSKYRQVKSRSDGMTLMEKNARLKELKVEFMGEETWCLTWFSHFTYNVHLSNQELLESFADFVDRKQRENVEHGHFRTEANYQNKQAGRYYCLMGAEDHWRWKGPCRCRHCVKFRLTRIDH